MSIGNNSCWPVIRPQETGLFVTGVFRAIVPWPGGAEDDEGEQVFGGPEGVHPEAGRRRRACCGNLPEGRDQPGDLIRFADLRFNWKRKQDGMTPPEMRRLKQLEDENAKLKRIVADLSLDKEMLQDVIRRKL